MQELSKEKQEKLQEEGVDVQVAASVSAGFGSVGVETGVKTSEKKSNAFEKAVENVKTVSIGSSPPSDGKKKALLRGFREQSKLLDNL